MTTPTPSTERLVDFSSLLWVEVCEAKPNPMFTEGQRQAVRFLRFNKSVKCAACGKKKRTLWTMLCEFRAVDFGNSAVYATVYFPEVFQPLTSVCTDHPIRPKDPEAKVGGGA